MYSHLECQLILGAGDVFKPWEFIQNIKKLMNLSSIVQDPGKGVSDSPRKLYGMMICLSSHISNKYGKLQDISLERATIN